jgi:hypothetical protein
MFAALGISKIAIGPRRPFFSFWPQFAGARPVMEVTEDPALARQVLDKIAGTDRQTHAPSR